MCVNYCDSCLKVYQLTDKAVPFLLRDLLSSNELIPIFGQIPVS